MREKPRKSEKRMVLPPLNSYTVLAVTRPCFGRLLTHRHDSRRGSHRTALHRC